MPITRTLGAGSQAAASAVAVYQRLHTPAGDAEEFTDALLVYAMPRLTFWIRQDVGALGMTVQPEFAVRSIDGPGVPTQNWLPLGPPVIINPAPDNPTLLQFLLPARQIRLGFTRPLGQATSITVVMAGSL